MTRLFKFIYEGSCSQIYRFRFIYISQLFSNICKEVSRMKRCHFMSLILCIVILSGCGAERFQAIDPHQSFIASMNILEPSLTFYDHQGDQLATWQFDKAYTGVELIDHDLLLLYGHQLGEAILYELSSGKEYKKLQTGLGVTNAYYDKTSEKLFITNSETNELVSYSKKGEVLQTAKLGNYPMSMVAYEDKLYVINYKDTTLAVVSTNDLAILDSWTIAKSSHGILVEPEFGRLWIGGHGQGSSPNQTVDFFDLSSGELMKEVSMPMMPVGFAKGANEVAVVSHGSNMLYITDRQGNELEKLNIAANPFAVAYFQSNFVVAGYDDQILYFIENRVIKKKVQTDKGPFQLVVREA